MNYLAQRLISTLQEIAISTGTARTNALKIEFADLVIELLGIGDASLLPKPAVKRMEKPSLEEICAFCSDSGIPQSDAEWFFHKMAGCGWTNGGKSVRSWKGTLMSWKLGKYLPSLKNPQGGSVNMGGSIVGVNGIQKELDRLHNQIRKGDSV